MHLTLWILTSLAIAAGSGERDVVAELRSGIAEDTGRGVVIGSGHEARPESVRDDSCTNWRLTGPEHCRWIHAKEIDAYLACVRAVERACQERAQKER